MKKTLEERALKASRKIWDWGLAFIDQNCVNAWLSGYRAARRDTRKNWNLNGVCKVNERAKELILEAIQILEAMPCDIIGVDELDEEDDRVDDNIAYMTCLARKRLTEALTSE